MRLDSAGPRTWLLATIAGWALLAWLLAVLGMGGRVAPLADDPGLLQPLPTLRPSPPERLGPLAQYAEIGARPLFSDDRKPKPFSLQAEGDGEAASNAFDYVLTSVLITPGLHMAIVQPSAGGESIRVKLGEAPEPAAAWRLIGLSPRSAVFAGPEGEKTLELRVYDGNGGEDPTQMGGAIADGAAAPGMQPPPPNPQPATPAQGGASPGTPGASPTQSQQASQEAQIEAIRKRIEARRAQLQQQSQPSTAPIKNP